MNDNPRFIIKPQAITQDPRLRGNFAAQDYLCVINQLENANGCTAGNGWFADYFGVTKSRASEVISFLSKKDGVNIIGVEFERDGKKIVKRTIKIIDSGIKESFMGVSRIGLDSIKESFMGVSRIGLDSIKESFMGVSRIGFRGIKESAEKGIKESAEDKVNIKNKDKKREGRSQFIKPTAEQVTEYAQTIGYGIDAQNFVDFYESKGWIVGKTPMKVWKAAVRTWKSRDKSNCKLPRIKNEVKNNGYEIFTNSGV